ncbi:MAG TPA: hypothetical protein VFM25_11335, partial [Verrucomicrobiae bacterium]|nr:hypothetical protein [Verrucomicrobiae bacterium]
PSPPGQPVHFEAESLSGGRVQLTWSNVPDAEIYRVYSDPGTNLTAPATLIADNILTNEFIDLPATDGFYRYVVTASRRGSEGPASIVRVAESDRTPPTAPTDVAVQLAASGLQVSWQPGTGETADHYNVYRNGMFIRTVPSATPIIDNPPRGLMSYTVAAADMLGNEAASAPAMIQMLVGAVNNLQVLVNVGQAPALSWNSTDSTAIGFNIYRNGIKQNASPVTGDNFSDSLPIGTSPVIYSVTAVNSNGDESAAREVTVYPTDLNLLLNTTDNSTSSPPILGYFDNYQFSVSNLTTTAALPLTQVELRRWVDGSDPVTIVTPINGEIPAGGFYATNAAVPCAVNTSAQSIRVRAVQQTDSEGNSVIYQKVFDFADVQTPGVMVELSANQLPLAGGLSDFDVRVYNRGYAPMYFAATRGASTPGDVYISIKNSQGQEVSRTPFNGTPSGLIFFGNVGYFMVPPGGSTSFTVPDVFVPEALASNTVTFEAVVGAIYDRGSAIGQQKSGPLVGDMQSKLSQTPYYATAQTDQSLYSNDQPVIISGQALNRNTGLPVPNVPLKIGFATRGYSWTQDVMTDSNGDYSYTYNVTPGLAGSLMIWAAHPDVVDQLNQAQITIYRIYASPSAGDIRMSKNDTLPFGISIFNPGDIPLTGFNVSFQAYEMQGTNQIPISTLHG